jgi:small-conductance mechanosensitive channel
MRMSVGDVLILGAPFLRRYEHELSAILTVIATAVIAVLADRWVKHRAERGVLSPELDTRVRFLRRLLTLVIIVLGGLFALSQFGGLKQLATGVLASSAIVAAVVGFAARQTLANLVAGVMLTIAQPLRIGDDVTVEDDSGVVEDVRLNYTIIRSPDGRRVFIPNERLASGVLRNDTILDWRVRPQVSLWIPRAADADQALASVAGIDDELVAQIAEVTIEGVRISLTGAPVPSADRGTREAALRADGLRALRTHGLLA